MIQLVLKQDIPSTLFQTPPQRSREIISQRSKIALSGQRDYFDLIPASPEMVDQHAIVKVSARWRIQAAIDDQTHMH